MLCHLKALLKTLLEGAEKGNVLKAKETKRAHVISIPKEKYQCNVR